MLHWPPESEDKGPWSAAAGAVMVLSASSAVLLATQAASEHVPVLVVYALGALALVGFYGMLAPLLRLWPWSQWDRKALLRACYKDGHTLQRKLSQRKFFDAKEAEDRAKESVYQWAEKTWKVLKQHFPGHEQDFLEIGLMAENNSGIFNTYCEMEIDRCGGSADCFLEAKLGYIGGLLRQPI